MAYLSIDEVNALGLRRVGRGVRISTRASVYDHASIEIGDYSRIDDFCIISGNISIGRYCHITPMCLVAGGKPGITLEDFSTLAYGVKVFAQTDDYSGRSMVNSLVPEQYKQEVLAHVVIRRHVIVGTNAIVFPGVEVAEGCAIGAGALVNYSTKPWGVYAGVPARRIKERQRDVLELAERFLKEQDT